MVTPAIQSQPEPTPELPEEPEATPDEPEAIPQAPGGTPDEPETMPQAPGATPQAPEVTDPVTVQSVVKIGDAASAAVEAAAAAAVEAAQAVRDELAAGSEVQEVVELPDLPARRPVVAEAFHLRRVRSARRH